MVSDCQMCGAIGSAQPLRERLWQRTRLKSGTIPMQTRYLCLGCTGDYELLRRLGQQHQEAVHRELSTAGELPTLDL